MTWEHAWMVITTTATCTMYVRLRILETFAAEREQRLQVILSNVEKRMQAWLELIEKS